MKYLIFVVIMAAAAALPFNGQITVSRSDDYPAENSSKTVVINEYTLPGKVVSFRQNDKEFAKILRDDRQHEGDGSYSFHYESDDGIYRSESGRRLEDTPYNPVASQGEIKFTFPNGEKFHLKFVADENGYQPESPWLPVAPAFPHPIPQFVLDQIEKAAREDAEAARRQAEEHRQFHTRDSYSYGISPINLSPVLKSESPYQAVREAPKVTKQERLYSDSPSKQVEERQDIKY